MRTASAISLCIVLGLGSWASAATIFEETFPLSIYGTVPEDPIDGKNGWTTTTPPVVTDPTNPHLMAFPGVLDDDAAHIKTKFPAGAGEAFKTIPATVDTLFGTDGTFYFGFVYREDSNSPGSAHLSDTAGTMDGTIGLSNNSGAVGLQVVNNLSATVNGSPFEDVGTSNPSFMAFKIEIDSAGTNNDTISLSIFDVTEDATVEPTTWDQVLTEDISGNTGYVLHLGPSTGDNARFDAFRIGNSYRDLLDLGPTVPSTDFTWLENRSGDWTDEDNWTPSRGPPGNPDAANRANHTALLGDAIQSGQTVFANTAVSVRAITFDNTNTYAVAGVGNVSLVQGTSAGLPANSSITVAKGNHQFQLNVDLQNNTDVDVASGASLAFNNELLLDGNVLTKTGEGALAINNNIVTGGGTFNCAEGTCSGTGTIGGDLINDGGTISPGNSLAGGAAVVPEPGSWALLTLGALSLTVSARRRRRRSIT